MIVVFSKDRAFQLEACLRTLLEHCDDIHAVPVKVLWTASNADHKQAYTLLRDSLKTAPIEFIEEESFRADLILILGGLTRLSWQAPFSRCLIQFRNISWMRSLTQVVLTSLLQPKLATLFAVDDTLFLRPFRFSECTARLLAHDRCLVFSLRLGDGITRFYMGDRDQEVPVMDPVDGSADLREFRWSDADGDFAYPLEVSSSILKVGEIFSRLLRKDWKSPNTLELALANMAGRYRETHPLVLTFRQPRAVAVPLNMVQKDFTANRHGGQDRYHPDELCRLFLQGVRADLSGLDRVAPNSVHAELDLLPATE
jgi:hypothetical protein